MHAEFVEWISMVRFNRAVLDSVREINNDPNKTIIIGTHNISAQD